MKKIIILSILFIVALLSYKVLSTPNSIPISIEEEILEAPQLEDEISLFDEQEVNLEPIKDIVEENYGLLAIKKMPLKNGLDEDEQELKDIMVEADMEEVKKDFPTKKGISPLIAIDLQKGAISKLEVGDKISLPYMGAGEYEATITTKKTHKNGSVTVTGNLIDSGNEYSIVLTEGKNMSFGSVTTPDGTFEIETKDGKGYVYSTTSIDNKWIDYSKSDTLEPHPH